MAGIEELKSKVISKNGMAFSNQFGIELPSIGSEDKDTLNILCKAVELPGKQIATIDRMIGMQMEKVVNGFAVTEVTASFIMLNDYGVKKYFDKWQSLMVDEEGGRVSYKTDYAKKITIHQLSKPQVRLGFDLGPLDFNFDLFGNSIYSVELEDAFPTSINAIPLANEADQLVEFSVQFSFTRWSVKQDKRDSLSDIIDAKFNVNLGKYI